MWLIRAHAVRLLKEVMLMSEKRVAAIDLFTVFSDIMFVNFHYSNKIMYHTTQYIQHIRLIVFSVSYYFPVVILSLLFFSVHTNLKAFHNHKIVL